MKVVSYDADSRFLILSQIVRTMLVFPVDAVSAPFLRASRRNAADALDEAADRRSLGYGDGSTAY